MTVGIRPEHLGLATDGHSGGMTLYLDLVHAFDAVLVFDDFAQLSL
ncbi:MAG: hypothetical protein AAF220_03610 [Pseudomonadota bacterium]